MIPKASMPVPSRRRSMPNPSMTGMVRARRGTRRVEAAVAAHAPAPPRPRGTLVSPLQEDRRGANRVRRARDDGGGDGREPRAGPGSRSPGGIARPAAPRTSWRWADRGRHARPTSPAPQTRRRAASRTRPTSRRSCSGRTASPTGSRPARSSSTARRSRPRRRAGSRRALRERGIGFVDAPVSGGSEGAKHATLTIFVGGEPDDVERARPVLEAMGKTITHFGPAGSGQAVKAVNQVVIAGAYLGVAEGIVLALKAGLDPRPSSRRSAGARRRAGSSRTAPAG